MWFGYDGFLNPEIESVDVTNDSGLSTKVILSRLHIDTGKPLDLSELEKDIRQIYAMDIFENVQYRLEPDGDGARLQINAREKSWGTNHIRFKLEFQEDFQANHDYNVGFQVTAMPLNAYGAEWRNEFQFGSSLRIFSEFYQPISESSQWFVSPNASYETPEVDVFLGTNAIGRYRRRNTIVKLDLGRQFGNWGELRAGFGYFNQRASATIGDPDLPTSKFDSAAYFAQFSVDTADSVAFPTRGVQGRIRLSGVEEALGAPTSFQQLSGAAVGSFTRRRWTASLAGRFNATFGDPPPGARQELGGFLQLSGLPRGSVAGQQILFGSLVVYRQIAAPAFFSFEVPVYLGGSFEAGGAWRDWSQLDTKSVVLAGSVFLGSETPFGPFYLAFGAAEGGNYSGYLFLGRAF